MTLIDNQISDRELDYLINKFSDKYYAHTGSNAPIVAALRDLQLKRAQVAMLKDANAALSEDLDNLKSQLDGVAGDGWH
jgi:hypothetical protein